MVKFAPPSVDFQIPYGGRRGARVTTPPVTELIPRTPRAEETYMIFALPGSRTIDEIERPSNAGPVYAGAIRKPPLPKIASHLPPAPAGTLVFEARCVQVSPPSFDL